MNELYVHSLIGGVLIGVSVAIMFLFNGRLPGNSSIAAGLLTLRKDKEYWKLFYVLGLVAGAFVFKFSWPHVISIEVKENIFILIVAGVLVGYGTRLGSGCTSGHGVCGMARLSKRSIVATVVFMFVGMLTAYFCRQLGF